MSTTQLRVQRGVREGGRWRENSRGEPAALDSAANDTCRDCGGELVVDGDHRAHLGRDGFEVSADHEPVTEADGLDDESDPSPAEIAAFEEELEAREALTAELRARLAREPEPDHRLTIPGVRYATDGSDVVAQRGPDGTLVSLTRGGTTFVVPVFERSAGYMGGSAHVGDRCTGSWRRNSEIARDIRADIRSAVAVGWLPSNLTYRVTSDDHTINVRADGMTNTDRADPEKSARHGSGRTDRDDVIELEHRLDEIRQRFGEANINTQFDYVDVSYYGSARITTEEEQRWERRERERRAQRRRSRTDSTAPQSS